MRQEHINKSSILAVKMYNHRIRCICKNHVLAKLKCLGREILKSSCLFILRVNYNSASCYYVFRLSYMQLYYTGKRCYITDGRSDKDNFDISFSYRMDTTFKYTHTELLYFWSRSD